MTKLQYHPLRVAKVVEETADTRSIELDVPAELREAFRYKPGQHLTLHVPSGGKLLPRCYSLSSSPLLDEPLRFTARHTVDGRASGWLCGELRAGDTLEVAPPAGVFTPRSLDSTMLMFAAGSGITPVFSIVRSVLGAGRGSIRLFYANRDERSVIFAAELARLSREHPQRLQVVHWLESVQGTPSQAQLAAFARNGGADEHFICGPEPFMDAAAGALRDLGIADSQVHLEHFVSLPDDADAVAAAAAPPPAAAAGEARIEADIDGVMHTVTAYPGQLLIEALEDAGLNPPFSCRAGACAACMCKLEEGEVEMLTNHVLDQGDLEQQWILACQALPKTPLVRVRYARS